MTNHKKLIYIVDDEPDICALTSRELQRFGYEVETFVSGAALTLAMARRMPHVCIIDLGLPDMDGLQLVRQLTETPCTGVIILSGRDSLPDRVLGLELGADDYVSKPFDPRELVARAHSIIRRLDKLQKAGQSGETPGGRAQFGPWQFDSSTLTLTREDGISDVLSGGEAELLLKLLKSPKQILNRDQLMGDREDAFDRSIDVRMSRIRKKLENNPKAPRLIKTVYGLGYMLTSDVRWL